MKRLLRFLKEEKGVTAVEYAVMAGIIAVGIILAVTGLKEALVNTFNAISGSIPAGS